MLARLAGGVGLFLLGMSLLSEGLRLLTGEALRSLLGRFTRSRLSGVLTGLVVTAVIQSSSATTVLTVGFVNARLIDFRGALGIIYGANVGTTTTAWLVSLLGFEVDMSALALPIVGVGAALRLFGRGRLQALGTGLAGFGVLFVGLDFLKAGMAGLAARVDLGVFGADVGGRLALVAVGLVMTVLMNSSSAAMAVTLVAVEEGAIGLGQAAALAIGQNMGTTMTALLSAVGGSAGARRTALAHVIFNAVTGVVALPLLAPAVAGLASAREHLGWGPGAALSAFHSGFNLLGLALFFPLTPWFAEVLLRLVPESHEPFERPLDAQALRSPGVAVEAARWRAAAAGGEALDGACAAMRGTFDDDAASRVERASRALVDVGRYLGRLGAEQESGRVHERHLDVLHAIDHLHRLGRTSGERAEAAALGRDPDLVALAKGLDEPFAAARRWLAAPAPGASPADRLGEASRGLADARKAYRLKLLEATVRRHVDPEEGDARLEAARWLDRLAYHVWRAVHHLAAAGASGGGPATGPGAADEPSGGDGADAAGAGGDGDRVASSDGASDGQGDGPGSGGADDGGDADRSVPAVASRG